MSKGRYAPGARFTLKCGAVVEVVKEINGMKVLVKDAYGTTKETWKTSLRVGEVAWITFDKFFGERFGKDNQVEVIGCDGEYTSNGEKLYRVLCHKCKLDTELFGEGVFKTTKVSLKQGHLPCGCAGRILWTKDQYKVRMERLCANRPYKLVSIDSNEPVSNTTTVTLICDVDGHAWNTSIVANVLTGCVGCPECRKRALAERATLPDDIAIARFMSTGSFLKGTTFKRAGQNNQGAAMWDVTCPKCSNDEYVKAGLCSGVFRAHGGNLNAGQVPCRCAAHPRLTEAQQLFRIQSIIDRECLDYRVVEWDRGMYKGVGGKIILECPDHGPWPVGADHFIHKGSRCPDCCNYGFDKTSEKGFVYVLKATSPVNSFTGYGISGQFDKRLNDHKRNLLKDGYTILATSIFRMDGQTAFDIENLIKQEFPCVPQVTTGFRREATHGDSYNDVVAFVRTTLDRLQQEAHTEQLKEAA